VFTQTAKFRLGLIGLAQASLLLVLSGNASAQQSVEENIRPVAQVCLEGQACVGTTGGGSSASAPVQQQAAQQEVEEVIEEVVEQVVEVVEAAADAFDVAATYQMSCFACHGTGAAGAPMLGDAEVWTARLEKGIDGVMTNVIAGVNAMPPKGLCMTCSDENLRSLVDYMVSQ